MFAVNIIRGSRQLFRKFLIRGDENRASLNTMTRDELSSRLGSPRLVLVDVLSSEAFAKIRIRGSLSIPEQELEQGRWKELDNGKEIVVYCASYQCNASRVAAEFLETKGFEVSAYEGGIREWAEAGLPTEGTLSPGEYLREKYGSQETRSP